MVAGEHHIIVGCGRVGSTLARRLTDGGATVTIIDKRPDNFERFLLGWPGDQLVGNGLDRDLLVDAGVERANAVATVTNGDNTNIIVARVARETFAVERVVARIYDPKRASVYQRLGIATIATTPWATDEAERHMTGSTTTAWSHPSGGIAIIERKAPADLVGRPVADAEAPSERIIGIARHGAAMLIGPDHLLQDGDDLIIATVGSGG